MTEPDWDVILAWNNDPDVLYFSEGDDVRSRTLDEVHRIYRSVCSRAFCFIIEYEDRPIGECWLQEMNLQRILKRYPGRDLRRIDIAIGEPQRWGRGLGTEAVRLLIDFGFERERCDAIFGCGVKDYNPRSRRMFERLGFVVNSSISLPEGSKAVVEYGLVLTRERYRDATRYRPLCGRGPVQSGVSDHACERRPRIGDRWIPSTNGTLTPILSLAGREGPSRTAIADRPLPAGPQPPPSPRPPKPSLTQSERELVHFNLSRLRGKPTP